MKKIKKIIIIIKIKIMIEKKKKIITRNKCPVKRNNSLII